MEKLTKRQSDILDTIKKFMSTHGYPPTVREIGSLLSLNSPATTHFHLTKLEEKGYIKKNESKNRALELLVQNEYIVKEDYVASIPLIGRITAGSPIEAIEIPNEFFTISTTLLPRKGEVFALKVSGESMIKKGINDGDIVIIEKGENVKSGEIIAAMINENEVTLKTFYKEKDHIRLQPENDSMSPIIVDNVIILGKAIGLYRKF